ncbi:MAG TPA: S41 family peptidase [Steroidobacteraceae bacterium]|jgi:tricorn protease|nr:S41 family peptidase [Steroidobacteraceae bacterium]
MLLRALALLLLGGSLVADASAAAPDPVPNAATLSDATLARFPTLHGDRIVFEAHDNLWVVARGGGVATRLTSDSGSDWMPRFSPDGRWIAFTGDYQGNTDVYVIPSQGGAVRRLTFWSDVEADPPLRWGPNNLVLTWTPDSQHIVFLSRRNSWNSWYGQLYEVGLDGRAPQVLPLDRGGLLSFSPDGRRIAYNRIFRNFRTWKRYNGGLSQHVYLYDLQSHALQQVTDWKGTDTAPMWYQHTIYFLSDRDAARRANLWAYDLDTRAVREVTHFTDYDIDFPSLGDDGIVFQQGGSLYVVDLPSETLHRLTVRVPDDGLRTGTRYVDGARDIRDPDNAQMTDYDLAPNGKRALFSARGDLFSLPAEHGNTRNLTQTSTAEEDHPAWSPDGRQVAYTTDSSGEQQIAVRDAQQGPERLMTHFASGYFYRPVWSPDADRIAFSDNAHRLWYVPVRGAGVPVQVAQDRYQEMHDYVWSPDGRWLAYSLTDESQQRQLWLYEIATHRATRISEPGNDDFQPQFDASGEHLYFLSSRHENPVLAENEFDIADLKIVGIYVATLKADAPSLFAPQSDEGAVEPTPSPPLNPDEARPPRRGGPQPRGTLPQGAQPQGTQPGGAPSAAAAGAVSTTAYRPGAIAAMRIDLPGLMARAVPLPIAAATLAGFDVRGTLVYYQTLPPSTLAGPVAAEKGTLRLYDLKQRKDSALIEDVSSYRVSADGSKLMFRRDTPAGKSFYIVDAGTTATHAAADAHPLDTSHMQMQVQPPQEWAEIFQNAWRLERDFFFRPQMNGVDWAGVRRSYARLLPLVGSRNDLNYLIGQVIGELSNSHTYVGGGDRAMTEPRVGSAYLGVDYDSDTRTRRTLLAHIYPGDNTRPEYRSPLTEPGLDVRAGDALLAIDGEALTPGEDPERLLVGKQHQTVRLTVAGPDGARRRDVVVAPLDNELLLRSKAWIDHNRQLVDAASHGRVGYIYLSDMEELGMEQFIRQFYGQLDRQALIVDDRWNGGGNVDQIVLERLRRDLVGMSTDREDAAETIPQQLVAGPKVCLINEYSASDGDLFPYFFRQYHLGPLIGMRTWGGVRGIRGDWSLLDNGYITIPEDAVYGLKSQWVIENHGVEPDMQVQDEPADLLAGRDAQLSAAVNYLLQKLGPQRATLPPAPPGLPAYPSEAH